MLPIPLNVQVKWVGPDTHVAQLLRGAAHAVHLDDAVVPPQRRLGAVVVPHLQRPGRNIVNHHSVASENLETRCKSCNGGGPGQVQLHLYRSDLRRTCRWPTCALL